MFKMCLKCVSFSKTKSFQQLSQNKSQPSNKTSECPSDPTSSWDNGRRPRNCWSFLFVFLCVHVCKPLATAGGPCVSFPAFCRFSILPEQQVTSKKGAKAICYLTDPKKTLYKLSYGGRGPNHFRPLICGALGCSSRVPSKKFDESRLGGRKKTTREGDRWGEISGTPRFLLVPKINFFLGFLFVLLSRFLLFYFGENKTLPSRRFFFQQKTKLMRKKNRRKGFS